MINYKQSQPLHKELRSMNIESSMSKKQQLEYALNLIKCSGFYIQLVGHTGLYSVGLEKIFGFEVLTTAQVSAVKHQFITKHYESKELTAGKVYEADDFFVQTPNEKQKLRYQFATIDPSIQDELYQNYCIMLKLTRKMSDQPPCQLVLLQLGDDMNRLPGEVGYDNTLLPNQIPVDFYNSVKPLFDETPNPS